MKFFWRFILFLIFSKSINVFAQQHQNPFSMDSILTRKSVIISRPTNVQLYKIDYEVKGWVNIEDSSKINTLNLEYYDSLRMEDVDLEVLDTPTLLTLIIYSKTRNTLNKQ
ncbi:MAG: hypothetical protein JWO32_2824 [Bacteroidetes bacterium]|nr:hypothetical protein [Bacteroidota bacterium]